MHSKKSCIGFVVVHLKESKLWRVLPFDAGEFFAPKHFAASERLDSTDIMKEMRINELPKRITYLVLLVDMHLKLQAKTPCSSA